MASGDSLVSWDALGNKPPAWAFVAFTSGSTEPSPGDVIWGDTSDENGILEVLSLESGTWGGGDAAGYMLLSNLTGVVVDWTSGENFTEGSTTPANHGTLTVKPVDCFATLDLRNNVPVLDFDDTANEVAVFFGILPRHYGGNGITVTLKLGATSATTLDVSFKGFFKSITTDADDIDTKNFAAPQGNAAIDAPSASGEFNDAAITFTNGVQIDSLVVGEAFFLLVMRDAQDSTADDMSGDAELMGIELKET